MFLLVVTGRFVGCLPHYALQDDENERHEVGAILFIGCCCSWIAVFVRWCRQDVFEEWINMVAICVFALSFVVLLSDRFFLFAFETCLISLIVIVSLANQDCMEYCWSCLPERYTVLHVGTGCGVAGALGYHKNFYRQFIGIFFALCFWQIAPWRVQTPTGLRQLLLLR
jgi:hypothetical protein